MVSVVTDTSVSPAVVSEEQHPPQADSYAVATLNRFLTLQDKATEPADLDTISSAVAPEVHHVSHLLPLSRPTVFWTMTHQLTLRLRENQFLTHLPHSCSNHRPRRLYCTRSLHRWSPRALNPADIPASDPADSECGIGVFTSPTSATRAPGSSCAAIVPYVPEFSCSDQSLVPFAAAVQLPASPLLFLPTGSPYFSLPILPACDSSQVDSPSWVSIGRSDDPLTTPSFHLGYESSPSSLDAYVVLCSIFGTVISGGRQ